MTEPVFHQDSNGVITIDWGTPNNEMPPFPVTIVPELVVKMVASHNRASADGFVVMTKAQMEEVDRNARAFGWEVGRGHLMSSHLNMLPANPFSEKNWREHLDEETPSNCVNHARRELELIGEEPETVEGYLRMIQIFSDMGHSGGSAYFFIPTLTRLLQFKNLRDLSNDPEEWMEIAEEIGGPSLWQNRRCSEAFSNDGGKTYTLLSERDKGDTTVHEAGPLFPPCGPTENDIECACGCSGDDQRCGQYMMYIHYRTTQVPETHTCCKIPGRD